MHLKWGCKDPGFEDRQFEGEWEQYIDKVKLINSVLGALEPWALCILKDAYALVIDKGKTWLCYLQPKTKQHGPYAGIIKGNHTDRITIVVAPERLPEFLIYGQEHDTEGVRVGMWQTGVVETQASPALRNGHD